MNEFSKVLKQLIDDKDIKIKQLAVTSSIDRTMLQKIIAGTRIPKDIETTRRILYSMMLTPKEYDDLMQLYMKAKLGRENYDRNLKVKKFFETFHSFAVSVEPSLKIDFSVNLEKIENFTLVSGKDKVYWSLKALIEKECSNNVNEIKVIMQPKNRLYTTMLFLLGKINIDLKIEHIICMDNNVDRDKSNSYNLEALKSTVPFIIHRKNYEIYIYYGDVNSRFNKSEMFPYLFIVGDYVITIDHDFNNAIIYSNNDALKVFSNYFEEVKKITKPLITKFKDIYDYLKFFSEKEKENKTLSIDFMAQPCLGFFVEKDFAQKYSTLPLETIKPLVELYNQRIERFEKFLSKGRSAKLYFTKNGIERFIKEGRIDEYDSKMYNPIDMKDRIQILRKFLLYIKLGKFEPFFINTSKFMFNENLMVSAIDEYEVTIVYSTLDSKSLFFKINEQSLVYSIFMFLEDMNESENILHDEPVLEYIEKKIMNLEALV